MTEGGMTEGATEERRQKRVRKTTERKRKQVVMNKSFECS